MSTIDNVKHFFDNIGRSFLSAVTPVRVDSTHLINEGPPRDSLQRRQSVAAESFDPEEDSDDGAEEKRIVYPKTDSQRIRLNNAVKQILLFRCLDEEQISRVLDAMQEKPVKANEIIIKQGDDGDNFYVIGSGSYEVYVRTSSDPPDHLGKKVCSYTDQGSFGELALMYNTSRAATIQAVTDGVLWLMDRNTFRRIVLKAAFQKRQMYEALLMEVPVLKELSPYERINVADALQSRTHTHNSCIISQGETGKEMFIIESGSVRIVVKEKNKEVQVNVLEKGAYFGEMALITKKPRAASVYAVGLTKLAVLDVASFERLMGPCLGVLERNMDTYQEQLKSILGEDYKLPTKTS